MFAMKKWTWSKNDTVNLKALGTVKYAHIELGAECHGLMRLFCVGGSSYYKNYTTERDMWYRNYMKETTPIDSKECAERLNISIVTLGKLVNAGHINTTKTSYGSRPRMFMFKDVVEEYLTYMNARRIRRNRKKKVMELTNVVDTPTDFKVNTKPINWENQVSVPSDDKQGYAAIMKRMFGVGSAITRDKSENLRKMLEESQEENLVLRRTIAKMQAELDARR